eukprot:g79383.t1
MRFLDPETCDCELTPANLPQNIRFVWWRSQNMSMNLGAFDWTHGSVFYLTPPPTVELTLSGPRCSF